jgi:hypothetical protein
MTVPDLEQLDSLPTFSAMELESLGGARRNLRSSSSRGASTSRIAQARDQDQDRSNSGAPVRVLHPFPSGSSFEPAIMEISAAEATRLASRTSEELRQQADHSAYITRLFNRPGGLAGVPSNEHTAFIQISTRLLHVLNSFQTRSQRDALSAAAAMLDSLASVKATNEEERMHFAELFNSANSAFFSELRTVIATEATSRQQDQADFRAGMEELRTLQLDAAANTARLFDFQATALDVNQRIGEVQERAMANNELLADLIRNQDTAAASNLSPEDLPVSRSVLLLMFEELKTHITSNFRRDSPAPLNGEFPNTQLNTLTTLCHDMGVQLDKMSQMQKWANFDELMLDSVLSFGRFDRLTATRFEESQKRDQAMFGQRIDHLTINLANLEYQLEEQTSNLGDIAARYEKYLDLLPPIPQEHVPQQSDTPYLGHIHTTTTPLFKPLLARDLDRLAVEVAHVRQLTYNSMIAQMAIDESKSRLDSTSACYDASCQHAEKVQEALKLATINLNLRQGQANSPDNSDFAYTVVHDPADHDFLGREPTPPEKNEKPLMATTPPSPPYEPLISTSVPKPLSTANLVFYGPQNLYPKRQCCKSSPPPLATQPPPKTRPTYVSPSSSAYKDLQDRLKQLDSTSQTPVKQIYPINRPFPAIGSNGNRRRAWKSLLTVIKHFQFVARNDILRWCSRQSPYSRCSLNTLFDIVCSNPQAEVPETYYMAVNTLDSRGCTTFDLDIIPIEHIMMLWK